MDSLESTSTKISTFSDVLHIVASEGNWRTRTPVNRILLAEADMSFEKTRKCK